MLPPGSVAPRTSDERQRHGRDAIVGLDRANDPSVCGEATVAIVHMGDQVGTERQAVGLIASVALAEAA